MGINNNMDINNSTSGTSSHGQGRPRGSSRLTHFVAGAGLALLQACGGGGGGGGSSNTPPDANGKPAFLDSNITSVSVTKGASPEQCTELPSASGASSYTLPLPPVGISLKIKSQ